MEAQVVKTQTRTFALAELRGLAEYLGTGDEDALRRWLASPYMTIREYVQAMEARDEAVRDER